MQIRDAVEGDIETVTDIFNQTIPDGDAEWTDGPAQRRRTRRLVA